MGDEKKCCSCCGNRQGCDCLTDQSCQFRRIAELEAERNALRSALRDIGKRNVRGEPYVWQYANKVLGRFVEGPTLLEQLATVTRERDRAVNRVVQLEREIDERLADAAREKENLNA